LAQPPQHSRPCLLHRRGDDAMLAHATVDKLTALRLPALAEALHRQLGNPEFAELSFEDRLGLLVDAEWTHREQRKLRRRLRAANLRRQASLEDIDWHSPRRGLDKAQLHALATCAWIAEHRNLFLLGPTGIVKSWLAEAFADRPCRSGHSAYRPPAARPVQRLPLARGRALRPAHSHRPCHRAPWTLDAGGPRQGAAHRQRGHRLSRLCDDKAVRTAEAGLTARDIGEAIAHLAQERRSRSGWLSEYPPRRGPTPTL